MSKVKRRKVSQEPSPSTTATPLAVEVKEEPSLLPHHHPVEYINKTRSDVAQSVQDFNFNKKRVRVLTRAENVAEDCDSIVYWMSRDARVNDNWALLYAQRLSLKFKVPLHVAYCLVPNFRANPTARHLSFLLGGLQEVERDCHLLGIPFHLLKGEPKEAITNLIKKYGVGAVVTDFSPLRIHKKWYEELADELPQHVPLCQVDAHNIVPCWVASEKLEYGARTIRRKIQDKLPEFLTHFPPVVPNPSDSGIKLKRNDWEALKKYHPVDEKVAPTEWAQPGSEAGFRILAEFCERRLRDYARLRNDPNADCLSNLSPWFRFGHISVQRAVLFVQKYKSKYKASVDSFVEEAVIRRELSDNFCYYNDNYDQLAGAWNWARTTLTLHAKDKRTHIYSEDQFEEAETHDPLWNAAQVQLMNDGKMHGFLRMYWAKKILEWTASPEEALRISIYLNDKYNLDGCDPNGFVGCMWSIAGIHDQGWKERPIFGKIRCMTFGGCKNKFDVEAFIRKYKKR